jgi:hypothetical protein
MSNKPLVIIESPYAGDVVRNERYAKLCMKDSFDRGEVPFVSHLLYTLVLDDTNIQERKLGMEAGFEILRRSDYSAVYNDYGISKGMEEGIKIAEELGHRIEYRKVGK